MIARYNNYSLALGIPGLLIQIGGLVAQRPPITLVGTVLLMAGLAFYAKAKGRSPAWCLMGFLGLIGLIVLALLKDQAPEKAASRDF
jgi:hypothetical protein